ncbi:epidermal growth factor-like protein [Ambystoma mexicanum]|uniref:epidermal growth factor-like protein n=1 Tax=Ambystoma mexicanum TaxID=8296 RepID=UPI0037E8A00D
MQKSCQTDAQYANCGTACPITCDNYSNPPKICTLQCVIGCACKDGYVLENATSQNCISPSECKKPCLGNAQYKTSGTACPLTCENYGKPLGCTDQCVCTKQCEVGCVCDDGYVLENESSDLCVHLRACKSPCQGNVHYETCGTACPENCADVTKPTRRPCTLQCKRGCFCNEGYVLENAAARVCVNESICKACEEHSHFSTCASACPLNCQNYKNPPKICTLICPSGCVCEEGYMFKSGESGPCVRSSECSEPKPTHEPPQKGHTPTDTCFN